MGELTALPPPDSGGEHAPHVACKDLSFAFEILAKRWSALILDLLCAGPARFGDLQRAIPRLSDKVLAERLVELTRYELVERVSGEGGLVLYRITESGQGLAPALNLLRLWAKQTREN